MYYIEVIVDGEPWEIELSRDCVYTKCPKCGEQIWGLYPIDLESSDSEHTEQFIIDHCPNCRQAETPALAQARLLKWGAREYKRRTGHSISEDQLLELVEARRQEKILTPLRKVSVLKNSESSSVSLFHPDRIRYCCDPASSAEPCQMSPEE